MKTQFLVPVLAAVLAQLACVSADPARRNRLSVGLGGGRIEAVDVENAYVTTGYSWHAGYGYTLTPPDSLIQVAAECSVVHQGVGRIPVDASRELDLQTPLMIMPAVRVASPSRYPVVFSFSSGPTIARTSVRVTNRDVVVHSTTTSVVPGFAFGFGSGFTPRVSWWFGVRGVRGAKFMGAGGARVPFHTSAGAFEVAVVF